MQDFENKKQEKNSDNKIQRRIGCSTTTSTSNFFLTEIFSENPIEELNSNFNNEGDRSIAFDDNSVENCKNYSGVSENIVKHLDRMQMKISENITNNMLIRINFDDKDKDLKITNFNHKSLRSRSFLAKEKENMLNKSLTSI